MPHEAAIDAALGVMRAHIKGLNARDETKIAATLHFPHIRLSETDMKVWDTPKSYFLHTVNQSVLCSFLINLHIPVFPVPYASANCSNLRSTGSGMETQSGGATFLQKLKIKQHE